MGSKAHLQKIEYGMPRGFTMVEIVIVLAMIILIAAIVLVSFPKFSQQINLQRSAQELALNLRKSQNMAIAVRQTQLPDGTKLIPGAYGLYFNTAIPGSYVVFADLLDVNGQNDGRFDPQSDVLIQTVSLDPGISIANLVSDLGGADQQQNILNITFSTLEGRMSMMNDSLAVGESSEIFLTGRVPGLSKGVIVRTTGQIQLK